MSIGDLCWLNLLPAPPFPQLTRTCVSLLAEPSARSPHSVCIRWCEWCCGNISKGGGEEPDTSLGSCAPDHHPWTYTLQSFHQPSPCLLLLSPWVYTLRLLTSRPCARCSLPLNLNPIVLSPAPTPWPLKPSRWILFQGVSWLIFHVDTLVPTSTWMSTQDVPRYAFLVPSVRYCPKLRDLVLNPQCVCHFLRPI